MVKDGPTFVVERRGNPTEGWYALGGADGRARRLVTLALSGVGNSVRFASGVAGIGGGVYAIAVGVILALAFSLLNSWVLLVEILR
ncbi:MAG: hypothetical protein WA814_11395 [Candidatus Baltobacteraceae bacterium]